MQAIKFKQYTYNFVGGGWNTEWAKTRRGAIAQAKKRWKNSKVGSEVDESTFRLSTDKEINELMSLFN
jgi:hypothetical protein